jgi:hypothetical protein
VTAQPLRRSRRSCASRSEASVIPLG